MLKKLSGLLALALIAAAWIPMSAQAQSSQEEIASEVDAVLGNISALAEAFPAEHYEWSPTEKVFSFRRHVVHVAFASYSIARRLGVETPEDPASQDELLETVTEKEDVIALLEGAREFAVSSIRALSDEQANSMVDLYGEKTVRAGFLLYLRHNSEHLGQLIAYARLQDIVPPWSE